MLNCEWEQLGVVCDVKWAAFQPLPTSGVEKITVSIAHWNIKTPETFSYIYFCHTVLTLSHSSARLCTAHWARSFAARQRRAEMRQSPEGRWREVSRRSRRGPRPDWFFKWTQNCVCFCVYHVVVRGTNTPLSFDSLLIHFWRIDNGNALLNNFIMFFYVFNLFMSRNAHVKTYLEKGLFLFLRSLNGLLFCTVAGSSQSPTRWLGEGAGLSLMCMDSLTE